MNASLTPIGQAQHALELAIYSGRLAYHYGGHLGEQGRENANRAYAALAALVGDRDATVAYSWADARAASDARSAMTGPVAQ